MATISVVIPVHGVEAYLPRCLDSVLGQSGPGIEVIAVDDASPDRCGEILAERGVTTIRTTSPAGPGRARELGAEKASGEYVWFVDGDDELAPGALAAVADALDRLRPDVLIVDYENLYPDGTTSASGADLSGPELTTLAERPGLINVTMTVWSKVFRRGFPGVAFGPGIHEDVPVSVTALVTATEIGVLNRACYLYRRERRGSFMAQTSDKHFAIFASYDRIFSELTLVPPVRAAVFERAIWHYTTLFPLVPAGRRREFFRQMTADFRRWRPPEFTFPPGARGAKMQLVARGAYGTYVAVEPLNRVRVALRRRLWCDWVRYDPRGDQSMRHVYGVALAVVMAAAVFFAAGWGYMRVTTAHAMLGTTAPTSLIHNTDMMEGVGVLLAVGLVAGLLMVVPWVSPLATGLPGLALLAWTVLFVVNVHDGLKYIPLKDYYEGAGFENLLSTGLLGAAGLAMITPMFIPSRWRRRRFAEVEVPVMTSLPSSDLTETAVGGYPASNVTTGSSGLLSDWSETRPQPQINPAPPRSQAPWGPADYS
jgi:glycosyltransferase involved in cell wall biosynthesis